MDTAKLYFYFIDLIAEKTKDISIVVFLAMALFGIFAANLIWLVMERKLNKMVLLEKKKVIVALIIYASIVYTHEEIKDPCVLYDQWFKFR